MNPPSPPAETCAICGRGIEQCACCEEPGCRHAVCYGCLIRGLGQALPQPHVYPGMAGPGEAHDAINAGGGGSRPEA